MSSKQQSSLASFFGGGGGGRPKAVKVQSRLNFGTPKPGASPGAGGKKPEEQKENVGNAFASPAAATTVAEGGAGEGLTIKPSPDEVVAAAAPLSGRRLGKKKAAKAQALSAFRANRAKGGKRVNTDDDFKSANSGDHASPKKAKISAAGDGAGVGRARQAMPPSKVKKRRVIDDSDSDEADAVDVDAKANITIHAGNNSKVTSMEVEQDEKSVRADEEFDPSAKKGKCNAKNEGKTENCENLPTKAKSPPSSEKAPPKKTTNDVLKPQKSMSVASSGKKKSDAVASGMLTDEELLATDKYPWDAGKNAPYTALCTVFARIESISARLEIQQALTDIFRLTLLRNPKDMYNLIYLASNSVAPAYECVELGVGDSILIKAIGEASGTNPSMIKRKYEHEGDLGTVAMAAKGKQRTLGFGMKPKPLLAQEVLTSFKAIATTTGNLSQKWKVDKIKGLLVRAQDGVEAKYMIRGLQGKLRIGLAQSTVLVSLAHAILLSPPENVATKVVGIDPKRSGLSDDAKNLCNEKAPLAHRLESAVNIVKKAYSEVPSFDSLLDAALAVPLQEMHEACQLRPGVPVAPMLAKPTKSVQEVLKRLNGVRFTCEYKYDGERAQVHVTPDGTSYVFSRNLLDTTVKYPEVPLYVKEACKDTGVKSFILDTEVVAFNKETQQFIPFQVLSTRKKIEESAETAKVAVIVQAFDLMYLNGESLLDRTLDERRKLLHRSFKSIENKFQFATSLDHTEDGDTTVLEEFLDTAVKSQCEGLMVKTLAVNAAYKPSERSLNWLKLKKDYLEGLGDSVDLVPIGAFHGRGKRTGVYGAYLLAVYDPETEEFQSVCKIGTGFSDEDLKTLSKGLNNHIIEEKSSQYNVSDTLVCDVWFDSVQVWEVKAADLSKSSTHKGAVGKTGEAGRGIGLRFPRFERVRPDKKCEQATTSEQILDMYYAQDSVLDGPGGIMDENGI
jgi:DNA ligase-1